MASVGVAQGHAPARTYAVQSRGEFPSRNKRKQPAREKERKAETETVFIMF